MNGSVLIIAKKEFKRIFTDKRLVLTLFVLPFASIILLYTLIAFVASNFIDDVQGHVSKIIINNPPESIKNWISHNELSTMEVQFVVNQEVRVYKNALTEGEIDLYVDFPQEFDTAIALFDRRDNPVIGLYYNYGEDYSVEAYGSFIKSILTPYKESVLINRFGEKRYLEVFDTVDLSQEAHVVNQDKATGKSLSGIVPMLLSIFLFAGAMSVVLESVAGEKERGTLATLLITPVRREAIALGKILSLSVIAILTALSSLLGVLVTLGVVYLIFPEGIGLFETFDMRYGIVEFLQMGLFMILLVSLYVGILVLISSYSKNIKEAGTMVAPIYMIIVVLSFVNLFSFDIEPIWKYMIPIYGGIIGVKEVLMFQMTLLKIATALFSTAVSMAGLTFWIKRLFNSEKMLFTE